MGGQGPTMWEIIARAPNGGLLCDRKENFFETHHKHTPLGSMHFR